MLAPLRHSSTVFRPTTASEDVICPCGSASHLVQFYETDAFLTEALRDYFAGSLLDGGQALLIATPTHLAAVAEQLRTQSLDPQTLQREGRLWLLDADETLQRICVNGEPDEDRFKSVIGNKVEILTGQGPLRAFGEMVALLWEQGKPEAALRLEEFWNRLAQRYAFDLFCAYPLKAFASSAASRRFARVCHAHGRVRPAETFVARAGLSEEQLREVALLQQRAAALEAEVTARAKVEDTLRGREAELTAFVETAALGLHWVNAEGIITWANQAELTLLGYSKSEYIGHHVSEFHADSEVSADLLARLLRSEAVRDYEARLRAKDGSIKTVVIESTGLWHDGEFVHSQCFTRDVTAQRAQEATFRHMAAIIEGSDDAVLSKNLDGIITSWNPGAERIFGYRGDEIIGRSITLLIPADRLGEEEMIIGRLRRGERIDHYETSRRRKDGTLIAVSLTISPVKDSTGKIVGASKIVRDVTEKKSAQAALEAARAELARSNHELEERVHERTASLTDLLAQMETFSYTISHDLRAPLRSMAGFAQVLKDEHSHVLNEEGVHFVDRIIRASERMNRLITDVLAYARVNRDRLDLAPLSPSDCLRHVIQLSTELQPPAASIRLPDTMPPVLANEAFLTQIFANLLGNAAKFTRPGKSPEIEIRAQNEGAFVRIEIVDNGIGIKPENQARLFGLFERLQVDKKYDGTGIGLAIVRRAVERMGGAVGVISDGETGSRFWFRLPRAEAVVTSPRPSQEATFVEGSHRAKQTKAGPEGVTAPSLRAIIAVDDDQDDSFVFSRLLRETRIDAPIKTINDGEDATREIQQLLEAGTPPSICFLDIKMPGLNGFGVLTWIRAQPGLHHMPVVMLSSSDEPRDIMKAIETGAQCFLKKHPSAEELRLVLLEAAGAVASPGPLQPFRCASNLMKTELSAAAPSA